MFPGLGHILGARNGGGRWGQHGGAAPLPVNPYTTPTPDHIATWNQPLQLPPGFQMPPGMGMPQMNQPGLGQMAGGIGSIRHPMMAAVLGQLMQPGYGVPQIDPNLLTQVNQFQGGSLPGNPMLPPGGGPRRNIQPMPGMTGAL